MHQILLQAGDVPQGRIIVLCLTIVAVIVVGLVVVQQVKRRMQHEDAPVSAGFTLSDLRQLHKSGQMTDEEFERAKAKVVEAARRAAERQTARQAGTASRKQGTRPPTDPGVSL